MFERGRGGNNSVVRVPNRIVDIWLLFRSAHLQVPPDQYCQRELSVMTGKFYICVSNTIVTDDIWALSTLNVAGDGAPGWHNWLSV